MKTRKILIAEDDAFSRGVMEKILQSYNYETHSCGGGEEAIVCLKEESFNILITDLVMPGMDGFELIRNARIIHPGLFTILVTGFPAEEVKNKVEEEAVDGFFPKPIDWNELFTFLDTVSRSEKFQNRYIHRNTKKESGESLSRKLTFVLILFLFAILNVHPSEAQRTIPWRSNPSSKTEGRGAFWQSSSFGLTEAQGKKLERLQQAFIAEAMPLRTQLMSLRFELRHLIRDQNVPSKTLFERQRKISELQGKLESLSLSYQIKARSIFTKEQLEQLPQDCSLGIEIGFGMGTGREPRKGLLK
jgi:CheY-like chemotaxis protein